LPTSKQAQCPTKAPELQQNQRHAQFQFQNVFIITFKTACKS